MGKDYINIDESTHEEVPTLGERLAQALVSAFLGFILVQIIGFWVFPGLGWIALNPFTPYFPFSSLLQTLIIAFLAVCAVMGWFNGKYFTHRLSGWLNFWKFW